MWPVRALAMSRRRQPLTGDLRTEHRAFGRGSGTRPADCNTNVTEPEATDARACVVRAGAQARAASAELREQSAALRAEGHQARTKAQAAREQSAAILEAVRELVAGALLARGLDVAAVAARFRMADSGTTGVEVIVELEDPANADRAAAAIAERFNGCGPADAITVR
jgi:hypothetical protein